MSNHRLISIGDAAKELGISKWQTRQLIKNARLCGVSLGVQGLRVRYVTRASLEDFLRNKKSEVQYG